MLNMTSFGQPINQVQIYILFCNEAILSAPKVYKMLVFITSTRELRSIETTCKAVTEKREKRNAVDRPP